jgi:hypothetical protein
MAEINKLQQILGFKFYCAELKIVWVKQYHEKKYENLEIKKKIEEWNNGNGNYNLRLRLQVTAEKCDERKIRKRIVCYFIIMMEPKKCTTEVV